MKDNTDNTARLDQGMWALCWPLLLYFFVAFSAPLTNSLFLSGVSEVAVGAVGTLWPLFSFIQVLFSSIAQAGCTVATQLRGAKQHALVPQTYATFVGFNVLGGALLALFLVLARHQVPHWLGLSGMAAELATSYLTVIGAGQVFSGAFTAYGTLIVSRGEPRLMFFGALLGLIVNVALNFSFVRLAVWPGAAGSVFAVALATLISTLVTLVLLALFAHVRLGIRFSHADQPNSFEAFTGSLSRVLKIGVPSLLEPLSYQGAQLALTMMIATFGSGALAVRVYVLNVFSLNLMASLAIGIATQMRIALRVGKADFELADAQFQRSIRAGLVAAVAIAAVVFVMSAPLLSFMTSNPDVRAQCVPLIGLGLLLEPFRAMNIIGTASLRATGDARYSCTVAVVLNWGIGVPVCYALGVHAGYGLFGIWVGMVLDEAMRAVVNLNRWRTGEWRKFRISLDGAGSAEPA